MASVGSNHSNTRLLSHPSHGNRRECNKDEVEMRAPLQPHHNNEKYEHMHGYVDDTSHQYEDPARFQDDTFKGPKLPAREQRGTPRKKNNDVYEPAKRHHERQYTDSSSESSYYGPRRHDPCWQCVRVMVFLVFFLALAALALIGMIVLGYVPIKSCSSCSADEPAQVVQASSSGSDLSQSVENLRANLQALEAKLKGKNDIIEYLQKRDGEQDVRIAELESKLPLIVDESGKVITNTSAVVGPPGPSGFNGSQGPPGPKGLPDKMNMSACRYEMLSSAPSTPGASPSIVIPQSKGRKVMAATCSTQGASEYNLNSRKLPDGTWSYECDCRGKSTLFKGKFSYCYIHFWTCPI